MMTVRILGQAVLGPGLPDWETAREVLSGAAAYVPAPPPEPAPALLPPNERRRASASVRWALAAGHAALRDAPVEDAGVATVFASCVGDGAITHQICEALATSAREVSPTRFHNSVHNAPAGYWSIATHSQAPSTSLCGYDASFAAGLHEAAAQAITEVRRVLLVAYDLPFPPPLHALWSVPHPLAAACLIGPGGTGTSGPRLDISVQPGAARASWPDALPREFLANPAAHSIPLLTLLARGESGCVELALGDANHLRVEVAT